MRRIIASTAFVSVALLSLNAGASGFSTARFGGEHGNPIGYNPTTLYYNPAGLSSYEGIKIMADANLAYRLMSYERTGAEEPDCVASGECPAVNNGKANLSNFAAAPMLGASIGIPIGENRLSFGAGFFVPFGGSAEWSKNPDWEGRPADPNDPNYFPGAVDGQQRWYSIDGTIRSLYVSLGAAFSIMDKVHIGASAGAAISQVDSIRARNATGTNDDPALEGRAWLDTKGIGPHVGVGVLATPLDTLTRLRIGFSYQSPPGITRDGQKHEGHLRKNLGGNISGTTDAEKIELHQQMPHVFRFGVSGRPMDDLELRLHGDVHTWSEFQDQCIAPKGEPCEVNADGSNAANSPNVLANLPRRWKDTGGVRLGASYWFIPAVEVFAGVGYDGNAVPDANIDAALNDFHDIGIALGGRFKPIDELTAAISYNHIIYLSRDIADGGNDDFQGQSGGPDNGGKYTQIVGFFNIHLIGQFDPFVEPAPQEQAKR